MSDETELRWRFKVIEVPKPMMEGTHYRFGFLGSGIACGAMWEFAMVRCFGQERGSTIIFAVVFLLLVWQGIHLRREHRRIQLLTEELRIRLNHDVGPELKDDERGDGSHEG